LTRCSRSLNVEGVPVYLPDFSDVYLTFVFSMKPGRVVVMLSGRRAGCKAVIVKQHDEGKKDRKFSHALVAGIQRAPLRVTRKMSSKKIARRSKLKPFVKLVNYNHILPTRFQVTGEIDLKPVCSEDKLANKDSRK
jgi:large subunit ribosomal protein L27e